MLPKTLHAGLLLFPDYQWLDAAGAVDYLNSHSQEYLQKATKEYNLFAKAPIIIWHYIAVDLNPVKASSGPAGIPTCTCDNCPPLDLLIVPGLDCKDGVTALFSCQEIFSYAYQRLVQKLMASERFIALLTVSTGSIVLWNSLTGYRVCTNKLVLRGLEQNDDVPHASRWITDRRWIVGRKVWSAAGGTAGIDLAAEFARVHFDPEIVQLVQEVHEYEPKPDKPDPFARIFDDVRDETTWPQYKAKMTDAILFLDSDLGKDGKDAQEHEPNPDKPHPSSRFLDGADI